jgi:hypothetical protein
MHHVQKMRHAQMAHSDDLNTVPHSSNNMQGEICVVGNTKLKYCGFGFVNSGGVCSLNRGKRHLRLESRCLV